MPITSDASPFTSVTASPMEAHEAENIPIELKIPLPASSACSDEEELCDKEPNGSLHGPQNIPFTGEENIHLEAEDPEINVDKGLEHDGKVWEERSTGAPEVSLEELAHFVDLDEYQRHRTASAQARRDQLSLSCGLERRLISTLTIAYGNMIDQYKTDDQAGFAGLYEACEHLTVSCEIASRSVEDSRAAIKRDITPTENLASRPYIQRLPIDNQEIILAFLTRIRTEPYYLSDRISNMSSLELTALTSSYHPAGIDYSVLQNHSHGKTQIYSRDSQMMKLSRRMDNLHRFHNEDPFFALVHGVFDSSAKPGSREDVRRTDIWSTVCAQNFVRAFTETRPGSDELAIAILDAFANFHDWPLKPTVETYIMRVLFEGSFLVETPSKQPMEFSEPMEIHNAKATIAEADFFENALTGLLELLTADRIEKAVPESALAFSHAVLRKIEDPKLRLRAKRYIVCSWYFATFVSSILVYPEVRDIMMIHHIGDTARKLILQQLVVRLQQCVFDVILQWNGHALVKPGIRDAILAIFDSFEPPLQNKDGSLLLITEYDEDASARFLMLSSFDLIGLIQALYPNIPSPCSPREPDSTIGSDRPSTAGSSTLIAGLSEGGSVLAPSTAPSTAEASVISTKDLAVSAEGPTTQMLSSPEFSEVELKKESSRASEMTLNDLPSQLRMVCRRIKGVLAQNKTISTVLSKNSWTPIYYSKDGSAILMGPETHSRGGKGDLPVSWDHKGSGSDDWNRNYHALKMAILKLLSEDERSGMDALLVLAKLSRNKSLRDPLETLLEAAMNRAQSRLDFSTSHEWWRMLESYRGLLKSDSKYTFLSVLQHVSQDLKTDIAAAAKDAEAYEVQCRSLDRMQQYHQRLLAGMDQQRKALRIKMWYLSDVRHSATYEEALHVTRALRSMARSRRSKHPGSITSWARQRLRGSALHEKAEAQTLEAIAATKDHGGPSKLADEQVEITSKWMTRKSVENFCKGEERIHRFCHEIQRSVSKIAGASLLDNPVLWSSNLFKRERCSFDTQRLNLSAIGPSYGNSIAPSSAFSYASSHSPILASQASPPKGLGFVSSKGRSPTNNVGGFWSAAQTSRPTTGPPSYNNQPPLPPTPTSPPKPWSSNSFSPSSPLHAFASPLPFNTSFGRHGSQLSNDGEAHPAKHAFAEQIKRSLCSLLLSDLGHLLWKNGSETDVWTNEHVAGERNESKGKQVTLEGVTRPPESILNQRADFMQPRNCSGDLGHQVEARNIIRSATSLLPGPSSQWNPTTPKTTSFPFAKAYATLLQNMSLTHDPWLKLQLLCELEDLALRSIQSQKSPRSDRLPQRHQNITLRSKSVPRTKATSLEEVIANCTERRAGTMGAKGSKSDHTILDFVHDEVAVDSVGTDDVVNALLSLFRDSELRPKTLFRDLQYIAAFVPSETLDQTQQGKAFWDAGLAALALKEDLCESMINHANEITTYHISATKPSSLSTDDPLASTTLRDAANLWLITAKEGSPVAARELGLFYLTHPELLPRFTMPFSKAKDVFKSLVANDAKTGDKEKGALDPLTFAVVFHWMEIAANGGDKDARDFLRGNGELSGGW